jgi:hypothetical protein
MRWSLGVLHPRYGGKACGNVPGRERRRRQPRRAKNEGGPGGAGEKGEGDAVAEALANSAKRTARSKTYVRVSLQQVQPNVRWSRGLSSGCGVTRTSRMFSPHSGHAIFVAVGLGDCSVRIAVPPTCFAPSEPVLSIAQSMRPLINPSLYKIEHAVRKECRQIKGSWPRRRARLIRKQSLDRQVLGTR